MPESAAKVAWRAHCAPGQSGLLVFKGYRACAYSECIFILAKRLVYSDRCLGAGCDLARSFVKGNRLQSLVGVVVHSLD